MHVVQPRPHLVNSFDHVDAGTHRMPDVDTATDARIVLLHPFQHIQRGVPQLILRPMVMNGQADVILLHEFFDAWKRLRSRVSGDNHGNSSALAVFKLAANILIFVLRKIDRSRSVKLDARRVVVRNRLGLRRRVNRKMVLNILRIEREYVELLHEANHLVAGEVAKRITRQPQMNRRRLVVERRARSRRARRNARRRNKCTRLNEVATRKIFHGWSVARVFLRMLTQKSESKDETERPRDAAPSPSHTRDPSTSSHEDRPRSFRSSCQGTTRGSPPRPRWKAAAS